MDGTPVREAQESAASDIDLVGMARWALRALMLNPRPGLGHECRFTMSLLRSPPCPGPGDHDPTAAGDTENRIDWAFGYMKDICGESWADDTAHALRRRILGFLRDDGLCWVPASSFSSLPGIWAHHWTTGKLLISLCEDFRRMGDEALRAPCRGMFEALRRRADWAGDRAYYHGGNSCWNDQGWAITDASPYHPAMPLEAIVKYYEVFGDEEALRFACAMAEGEMANDQWEHWILRDSKLLTPEQRQQIKLTVSIPLWPTAPRHADLSVRADGSFDHHSHMRGHLGWGMAHLARITAEPKLVAWCKRLLDFFLSQGTDFGWIPESMTAPRRSETCAVADVIDMAAELARAGHPDYWDTVERFARNYLREAQFFLSPDYEELYRSLHSKEAAENGLAMAADLQGGFQGAMGVTDRCYTANEMDMMGCCVPEGMRGLHTAWSNAVTADHGEVRVNLCFDRQAAEATVRSLLPDRGRMEVTAHKEAGFFLRPPGWAPRNQVKMRRDGRLVDCQWHGAYIFFPRARNGEKLAVEYPLRQVVQRQTVRNAPGEPDREISVSWLGNTVTNLEPKGQWLPLYQQVPRPLPAFPHAR